MTTKVIKPTTKGQITLPKTWRDLFNTNDFILEIDNKKIIIKPIDLKKLENDDEIIFDAERDNNGKGVSPNEIIKMLKEIKNG